MESTHLEVQQRILQWSCLMRVMWQFEKSMSIWFWYCICFVHSSSGSEGVDLLVELLRFGWISVLLHFSRFLFRFEARSVGFGTLTSSDLREDEEKGGFWLLRNRVLSLHSVAVDSLLFRSLLALGLLFLSLFLSFVFSLSNEVGSLLKVVIFGCFQWEYQRLGFACSPFLSSSCHLLK
ncbi:hypothetical protein Cni_G08331 [Canna indica]|uniref:Transmembrane protein n=1 Tax=Canna indica TaxID=4628 RepID=A0AAQ3K042_9LILI|nr:hypothetical protein Cni_G08331 [Canna indica]